MYHPYTYTHSSQWQSFLPQNGHEGADKKNSELREAAGGEAVGLEVILFRRRQFLLLLLLRFFKSETWSMIKTGTRKKDKRRKRREEGGEIGG